MDFELTEDQQMLKAMVKDFREKEIDPRQVEFDEATRIPDDLLKKYADIGLYGMTIPPEWGGTGAGSFSHILAIEELAYSGTFAWWPVAFNNSLPEIIYHHGTDEQKEKFLKGSLDGDKLFSVQFTEAETGSDPAALVTTSKVDGDEVVINGMKRFSTFGARPGTAVCYTKDEDGNCTAYLLEKHAKGYTAPKVWDLMGGGGAEPADVYYDDYRVPKENMLGEKGKAFNMLLDWITGEKVEGCIVAVSLGQAALDEAIEYAKNRTVREKPMTTMQGIRWELADIYTKIQACRWYTYRVADLYDRFHGTPSVQIEAAGLKIFVQPAMTEAITTALRLHGGYGYTKDFKVERLYRAQPGNIVISVSLEINKTMVGGAISR